MTSAEAEKAFPTSPSKGCSDFGHPNCNRGNACGLLMLGCSFERLLGSSCSRDDLSVGTVTLGAPQSAGWRGVWGWETPWIPFKTESLKVGIWRKRWKLKLSSQIKDHLQEQSCPKLPWEREAEGTAQGSRGGPQG